MNVMYFIRASAATGRLEHFPKPAAFLWLLPIQIAEGTGKWVCWCFGNNYKRSLWKMSSVKSLFQVWDRGEGEKTAWTTHSLLCPACHTNAGRPQCGGIGFGEPVPGDLFSSVIQKDSGHQWRADFSIWDIFSECCAVLGAVRAISEPMEPGDWTRCPSKSNSPKVTAKVTGQWAFPNRGNTWS